MENFPKVKRLGEKAILLEFEPEISPSSLDRLLRIKNCLRKKTLKEEVEITNSYCSLLITYKSTIEDAYTEVLSLKQELERANISHKIENRLFHIPVCYDEIFGLDLEEISAAKNMTKKEIIKLHSSQECLVYFTGFLPGFLYLGGLPEKLHFSRKNQPRLKVEKGAVGIGEKQTGIYPQDSPGGWNIIGNSPVPLFDPAVDPPCLIKAGDRIRFYPVSVEEHRNIKGEVEEGRFSFNVEENG